jgi:hypothetical protein
LPGDPRFQLIAHGTGFVIKDEACMLPTDFCLFLIDINF